MLLVVGVSPGTALLVKLRVDLGAPELVRVEAAEPVEVRTNDVQVVVPVRPEGVCTPNGLSPNEGGSVVEVF